MERKTVCIFCASSDGTPAVYREAATQVGALCARAGVTMINGGGKVGLMGLCSDACLENGGRVTGIIPEFMVTKGWGHEHLSRMIVTPDMGSRKQQMRELSDGVIALPGGCGTMEEVFETITQRQLGFYPHPIILLNTNGFFSSLETWWETALKENFMREEHKNLWTMAETPEEALQMFLNLPDIQEPGEKRVLR
jgi:uncharacterized protein (TIGR00730 family)